MATLVNKHEEVIAPFFKNGVTLDSYVITFESDVTAKLDADTTNANPRSPVAVALEAIAQRASIEIIGTVQNLGTGAGRDLRIAVSNVGGIFPTDDYSGDGTANETMAAYLTALVAAAGTHQGVNLANSTVTRVVF
jgi:hypothetical protein